MREYVDFLGRQSPFDALDAADLDALARLIEVEYFSAGTTIVDAGGAALRHFYVVRTGEVELLDRGRVVDVLGPGETFGQISVLSGLPPPLSVRAAEDALCYRFPDPRPLLHHPERLQFSHYGSLVTRERLARSGLVDQALRAARHQMRPVVWCAPDETVTAAASVMTEAGQSCALLLRGGEIGIVTDSDFRAGLAAGRIDAHTPIHAIASFPAAAIGADTLVGDAFLRMVECGFHHLVVTGAGEKPIGILRVVDLASAEVRNPLVIRRAVDEATSVDELATAAALLPSTWLELYDTGVAVMHIAGLLSAVIDSIMLRLIELTDVGDDLVPQRVSWLVSGSVARREPLPRSDLDTSIVWEDLEGGPPPARKLQRWAGRVLDNMERCGLPRCADGANATNPLFAHSQSDAIALATSWITNPTQSNALLLSSMIADSRPVTGVPLGRAVVDSMLATTRSRDYLSALLRFAISARPPLGFVRNFVVEHSGEHRGRLNLKAGGLVPIASLGRWIAIVTGDDRGSTATRLRRGEAAGLLTSDETETLVRAFEYIYGLILGREIEAIRAGDASTTTWIAPNQLDTLTRRYLREAFRAVAEVQNRLDSEWVARLSWTPRWLRRREDPLAKPWREVEYVSIDLETTGLDLKHDSIASYGAVVIRDGRIVVAENAYGLVCPTCEMTTESITVHALRPADVADAPPLSRAVAVLDRLLRDRVLIAHAAWIEQAFLTRAFAAHGRAFRSPVIDTAALARAEGTAPKDPSREPGLEWLAGKIGLPAVDPHHALGDATTTAQVFLALTARLGRIGYGTSRDFVDLTAGDRLLRTR